MYIYDPNVCIYTVILIYTSLCIWDFRYRCALALARTEGCGRVDHDDINIISKYIKYLFI